MTREFLKDTERLHYDFSQTDQARRLAPPPIQQPVPDDAERVALPKAGSWQGIGAIDLTDAIANRESRRRFTDDPLSLDELSYLLWATQGLRGEPKPGRAFRTVPSAGCRHAFETYICALRIEGLEAGLYRYLPLSHELALLDRSNDLATRLIDGALGQKMVGRAAATFVWTAVPYRMEWRYGATSHRVILIDAGHLCQNLYLAVEAIGAGTCAVAAYHQHQMDALLGVDGEDEFTVYLAPVGKV